MGPAIPASTHVAHRSVQPLVTDKNRLHRQRLWSVSRVPLFFELRPVMRFPALNRWFIALAGSYDRFLQTETHLADQIPTMIGMIAHAEFALDSHGQPPTRPGVSIKAIRSCSFRQHTWEAGLLFCGETGAAPFAGWALRPSAPPSRPLFIHWLMAPSVTPSATAMSFCFHPACLSSQARLRLSSRQSANLPVLPCLFLSARRSQT